MTTKYGWQSFAAKDGERGARILGLIAVVAAVIVAIFAR